MYVKEATEDALKLKKVSVSYSCGQKFDFSPKNPICKFAIRVKADQTYLVNAKVPQNQIW